MNIFKVIEDYISDWLEKDTDVEGKKYFTKILDENRNFRSDEIPAISTYAFSITDNKTGTSTVSGKIEIFIQNQNTKTNNDDCKKVVSQIFRSLKKKFVPGVIPLTNIAITEINSERGEAMPSELFKGSIAYGYVDFSVKFMN